MKKAAAYTELLQAKYLYDSIKARDDAARRAKLQSFLQQHQCASQWATCIAALEDARRSGVQPSDEMIADAIRRCGMYGQLKAAKMLYTSFHKQLQRPRALATHTVFMGACADASNFTEADAQFQKLLARDKAMLQHNPQHKPAVNEDFTSEYLRAALAASARQRYQPAWGSTGSSSHAAGFAKYDDNAVREDDEDDENDDELSSQDLTQSRGGLRRGATRACEQKTASRHVHTSPSSSTSSAVPGKTCGDHTGATSEPEDTKTHRKPDAAQSSDSSTGSSACRSPWSIALTNFIAVRQDPLLRASNTLTPVLLDYATRLAELGGQWKLCLQIIHGAGRQQALVPPEAYDAAIRACYRHGQFGQVVQLMQTLTATHTAPDERSVRMTLVAAEEVAAQQHHCRGGAVECTPHALSSSQPHRSSSDATHSLGSAGQSLNCAESSSWSLALSLFHAMQENGLPLYQQSYEAPLRACALSGKWKQALDMLQRMRVDGRPISTHLYQLVLAARLEGCVSVDEVRRLMKLPLKDAGRPSAVVYVAAMRCCMRLGDWNMFESINRAMKAREIPETYDKMRLLIEAAYVQKRYHVVLLRFARFVNVTEFERGRVLKDKMVRLHETDFAISERLLDMVLDAYAQVTKTDTRQRCDGDAAHGSRTRRRDSTADGDGAADSHASSEEMYEKAHRAALERKRVMGVAQLSEANPAAPDWMFSQKLREERHPGDFH